MSRGFGAASARSGFMLGLTTGVIITSAFFMLRDVLDAPRNPRSVATATQIAGTASGAMTTSGKAGPMEAATLALQLRLATQGGSDDQWDLLATSYDVMGRSAEAQLARDHRTPSEGGLHDAVAASARLLPGARATHSSTAAAGSAQDGAAGLLASAERHRRKREFKQACDAYAAVVAQGAMNADAWSDYADAQASLTGRLAGAPEKAIDAALALDPEHPKALWLKASVAHEQHRYAEALSTWRRLLAVVPPGSSDARIVEANIAEATRLASS